MSPFYLFFTRARLNDHVSVVYDMNGAIITPVAVASAFICVSGGIAIGGAQSGNLYLVVATMVMSTIFALSALLLFPLLFMVLAMWFGGSNGPEWLAVLLILLLVVMVIVPTISACLTCKPLCSQERPSERVVQPNQAHYQPNRVNQVHHQHNRSTRLSTIPTRPTKPITSPTKSTINLTRSATNPKRCSKSQPGRPGSLQSQPS